MGIVQGASRRSPRTAATDSPRGRRQRDIAADAVGAEGQQDDVEPGPFDPADATVVEVLAYVTEHPDETERIVAAETAGKARTGILSVLSG